MDAALTAPADTKLEAELLSAVEDARDEMTGLLATLVRFPSLLGQEASAQDYLEGLFQGMGLKTLRFPVRQEELAHLPGYSPSVGSWGRHDNVVGAHRPDVQRGRSLIFNGHIDVVPVGDEALWSAPPFEPVIDGDRMYGRGAGDMKAGIAAYITAFRALQRLGYCPAAPLFLQSVVEEECTGNGALACLHRGFRAEAAVIPEPFDHSILCAQVGVMWITLEVLGRPAHVLDTAQGINAIEAGFALYQGLKRMVARWNEPDSRHPAFAHVHDPIKINLGRIQGGEWTSSVPTRCTLEIRLGSYPGVSAATTRQAVEACLRESAQSDPALQGVQYEVRYAGFQAEGFAADTAHPMMTTLATAHEAILGTQPQWYASTATTDARVFALYGSTPATCYGPRSSHIHAIDEWVSLSSTLEVAKVLALFMTRWCGVEKR
ncbi:MAG: ArgE/DapE family deacylase [Burkholderiales bacterium]|nr:ArgE/DapE family deacylase [Burkholderiales bacterium]